MESELINWVAMLRKSVLKLGVILFLCCPGILHAQDVKVLREQMETVFRTLRPADRKSLADGFVSAMSSSFLNTEEKGRVDSLFRELQELHVTVSPELSGFVGSVNRFCEREEKTNLLVWLDGLQEALASVERKRMTVKRYLELTIPVSCERVLTDGNSQQWLVRGELEWREGKPIQLVFRDADLVCCTRKDTICISETSGIWRLGDKYLSGSEGKVRWKDSPDGMFAELQHYQVDLKTSGYKADSVLFHYETRYNRPLWGQLRDNALKYARNENTPFPEFVSYATDIELPGLFKDINYRGGITYSGMKFSGTGNSEQPAALYIEPNDTISMRLYSQQFLFDSLRIMSGKASMEIVMDSGKITHSNINFLYMGPRHTVIVKRISDQSLHLPFKDSYHRILFDMEEIYWPVDSHYMEMRMSSRSGLFKATIESMNFFSDEVYDHIQGLDEINPLNGLLKCSKELGTDVFTVADYAGYLKKAADQLRRQIVLLSYDDFVDYDEMKDEVRLKQRLYDYTRARVGNQDYDNIRFTSQPGKERVNALLDVRNYNLRIRGVDKFMISESKNISVEPSDKEVVMMKNRDMSFNGKLNAGMFDMYGNNLFFSYDKYTIALPKVDSTSMYMAGQDKHVRGRKVGSLIRDVTGEIVIDKPDNKSGKKEDTGYPVLTSTKESYVYFDDPVIQQGQYRRDSFYYKIKPYSIKGINDASRFRYVFAGTLVSHIVSPIEDTLRLLEDKSLGLTYRIPEQGIELYGKGRTHGLIVLDKSGFNARGKVDMNKSEFHSDSILMLPRQMTARTREITVNAIPDQRPGAKGKEVLVRYLPETGSLQASSTAEPFDVYEGKVKHQGKLMVYEQLLDASGRLEIEGANLNSGLFRLKATDILSDKTALNIASVLNKDIQLNTSDVKAEIDLLKNKARFINNTENNRVDFTSSRYSCSFESFTWYMKEASLHIGTEDEKQLADMWKIEDLRRMPKAGRNIFVSTNPRADSLTFTAPQARYDLKSGDIGCRGVNHIDLANGRFYPEKGGVDIRSNGEIQEFENGKLVCERTDTGKILTGVKLKLSGRYQFAGEGDYLYVSEEKKTSNIHFTEIGPDSLRLIFAKAGIAEEQALGLNEGLKFKGNIVLNSRQPDLYFAGYAGLTAAKDHLEHTWVEVKDYLSAQHIRIPLKVENKNDKQQRIYNGIYLNTDKTFKPYAAFMSNRKFYKDDLLAGGAGMMEWSAAMKQYIISDTLRDKYYRFRYDPEEAVVSSYGLVDLELNLPGIYQKVAGDVVYHLENEELNVNDVLYLVDFPVLSRMEAVILKDFTDKKLKRIAVPDNLCHKVYEICGKPGMPAVEKQLSAPAANVPDSLHQLFVLDSLCMKWNEPTRSYVANGQVNVVAIRGKPVDKRMNVKMELLRSRSGNQYFMYIYDDKLWYYFEYSDRNLYTLSSNEEYNEYVKTEKADKKEMKDGAKATLFTITLCPDSKRERFLKRVK